MEQIANFFVERGGEMRKHILFFLAMFIFLSLLNLTIPFYDQHIRDIMGISFVATFFNWLVNLPTSKKSKDNSGNE